MAEQHPGYRKSESRSRRAFSPALFRRRIARRGQTLTEYGLLITYLCLFTIQAMQSMGFTTTKEYVITNCSIIVGRMQNRSQDDQMSAVDAYLSDPSSWNNADSDKVAAAVQQIHDTLHHVIYGN